MTYALVTGASSGIGAEFARQLAKQGKNLILVARRLDRLTLLAKELRDAYHVNSIVHAQDLSIPDAAELLYRFVHENHYDIDLVINNAGFGLVGSIQNLSVTEEQAMLYLNIVTLQVLTHLFINDFVKRKEPSGIINVASTAAFQPVPYMATYAASKAFVLHFTEAIAAEYQNTPVRIMALCPGLTTTEFQQVARIKEGKSVKVEMTPQAVVALALRAYQSGKVVVIPGFFNKVLANSIKWVPRQAVRRIGALLVQKTLLNSGDHS